MRQQLGFVAASIILIACGPKPQGDDGDDTHGDDTTIDASWQPFPDAAACAVGGGEATEVTRPVDIIWVIDNSGSMNEEEARIQTNMNNFATSIASSGIDYHVIVIADTSHINVPPPLGGSPQFLGLNINIDSHDALQMLVQNYSGYQAFLRPDSLKQIVVVTDDESDWSQAMFENQLGALTAPGFGTDWQFNAVVAEGAPWDFSSHCFALSANIGAIYISLRMAHPGVFFSLCDTDWTPLFAALAQSVIDGAALPCTYDIPDPPPGEILDPLRVNFIYTPQGGAAITFPNVGDAAHCGTGDGWYYDDPANPTSIIVCPTTCTTLQGDAGGAMVKVEFGCGTVIP